jgi:3-dehydroquinate synthase
MREITVPVPGLEYPIRIGGGLIASLGPQLRSVGLEGAVALVQDAAVAPLYGEAARASLGAAGYSVTPVTVPSGEASKCLACLGELYDRFAAAALDRNAVVVALGGGVVGDLAGFAAASYLRGIALVQVPTTLLSQVDSSVGGKTGIDLAAGKNLVGAFHQPRLVVVDPETLRTLPDREHRAGLAEVLKYGVIWDESFFAELEANRAALLAHQPEVLERVIARCCEIKAAVVGEDERESGLRAILNYGHTVGHAIEAVAGYGTYLHGEAIAIGMVAAGALARRLGLWGAEPAARVAAALGAYGLPTRLRAPLSADALLAAMQRDKKTRAGELRFVLPDRIGLVRVHPVAESDARAALAAVRPDGDGS